MVYFTCNTSWPLIKNAFTVCPSSASVSAAKTCWLEHIRVYFSGNCYSSSDVPVVGSYLCSVPDSEPGCTVIPDFSDMAALTTFEVACISRWTDGYCVYYGSSLPSSGSGGMFESSASASTDAVFDWGKVRTGFSDSFDFFVLIFAVWCIVKLIRSIR